MISDRAVIDPGAKIGEGVKIGPFSVIHDDVVLGDNVEIANNVTILPGTRIGKGSKVHSGAVLGGNPQDLKYKGEYTTLEIGENNEIREFVTMNRGTGSSGKTVVGDNNLIMAYVHIAHDCAVGNQCVIVNYCGLAGEVEVGDWAIIGGATVIHQFCHIGTHAMISGGSKIMKDVPPFIKAGREPLAYVGVNSIGLRRRGFINDKIREIQEIYRMVYLQNNNNAQAVELIEAEMPASKERDEIIMFIRNSKRGVIRGYDR